MDPTLQTELVAAISASRTRAEDAPGLREDAVGEALRKLRADAGRVVALGRDVQEDLRAFLRLPDEHQDEAALTIGLVFLGFVAERLEGLATVLSTLENKAPNISMDLSSELAQLAPLADDFRDLEETFALSLSPTFREEIKRARAQVRS
jgi:hypothetical protein